MRLSAFALTLFAYACLAGAQELPDRVGRLSSTEGTVSIYQDPEVGWEEAFVNSPITSENSVWTERGARAEVQVGASILRLDGATQLDVWRLDQGLLDARVESGSLAVRIRYRQASERYSIATPHARFELQADGRYRIDVDLDRDESRLTVFSGSAALDSQRGLVRVDAGRSIVVYGEAAEYVAEAAQEDDFDRWSAARDREWRDGPSRNYVSTYVTGYEDLDRYGEWSDDASYGALWFPASVAAGWAPYRYGHWGYVRPWGWTWIDDARWGYAPFHYGRWVYVRNRWAWSPGQRVARPTWAPALVAWVGGSNFAVGVTGPALGWYPLAPWERYQPWYQASRTHTDRVNVAVRNSAPRYLQGRGDWRTWNREHGATVVNRDTLVNRRPVGSSMVRVAPGALRDQPVAQGSQVLPPRNEWVLRRAEMRPAPAPLIRAPVAAPPAGAASRTTPGTTPPAPSGGNPIVRPDFSRRAAPPAPAPAPANQPPAARAPGSTVRERAPGGRDAEQAQERAAREAQRQQQEQARDAQQRQQQQEQERAAREAQQRQQLQQQQQDRAARDAQRQQQQEQERAAREAQQRQQQQQQQQERAARDAQRQQQQQQQQQEQDRAAREAMQRQQQQQQQQDRAARDAQRQQQQEQERAAREAQQRQQQQQQEQERAARDAQRQQQQQQQQQEQAREAQRQLQQRLRDEREEGLRQARERQQQREQAQREQVQREAQERAIRESQQQSQPQPQQQQQQQQPQPQERAQPPQGREARGANREKADKDKDKDKEDKR